MFSKRFALHPAAVLLLGLVTAALLPSASAQNAVRGKALYFSTNGASLSCGSSGCHNGFPTVRLNAIAKGSSPAAILSAITGNKGGMGILSGFVNNVDAADIAAYIANPAAGDASAPTIALSASTLSFVGQTVATTSAAQTVTVSNSGTAALTISTLTFGGTAAAEFARAGTCAPGGTVAAGGNCSIQVTFTPSAAGARNATLTIAHSAPGGNSTVTLSGTGNAAAAAASIGPAALSFSQSINTTSNAQAATLTNTGGLPLTISAVTLAGTSVAEYAIAAGTTCTAGATVNGGASCLVQLTFTPSAIGARTASLSVAHSASATPAVVALNGTGSAMPQPAVSLSAAALTFAAQSVGTNSAAQNVTLTNTGQATLTLTSLALSGAAGTDFTRAGTCAAAASIAAGGTCTIQLAFAPTAVGARTATLTVVSNAGNGDATLALSGSAVQVAMSVSPTAAALQSAVGLMSPPVQAVVSNTGQSALVISSIATTGPFMLDTGANQCGAAPITLSSGQSCNVFVAFHPVSAGMFNGEVAIMSNAAAAPARVVLTAQAVATAAGTSATEPSNLGFGGCSVGAPDQLIDPLLAVMLAIAVFVVLRRRAR